MKKAVEILKKFGLAAGKIDPCLYVKKSEKSVVYVALYVDDNLMVGDVEAIDKVLTAIKENGLVLKIVEELHDYMSCEIMFSADKERLG